MLKTFKLLTATLKTKTIALSLAAVAGAYIASLIPVYLGRVLDGFAYGIGDLIHPIMSFAALYLSSEILNILRRVSVDRMCASFEENLRNKSIGKMLRLPLKDLIKEGSSGEITAKMNESVSGASQLMRILPNDILPALFVGIFVVYQCLAEAPAVVTLIMVAHIATTLAVSIMQIRSQKVHYIPPKPHFIASTIRENIAYGLDTLPSEAEMKAALKRAGIHDDLAAIGDRPLDVTVQEGGSNFSSGQQKKIALCRAYLRKPKFFILDETMANVDIDSIPQLLGSLEDYAGSIGASIIHIAHDQSIISRCDNIVVLQKA